MNSHLYIDCKYGISGDMFLSSLIDLGADIKTIKSQLETLPNIDSFKLNVEKKIEKGITSKELSIVFEDSENHGTENEHSHNHGDHHHRNFKDIKKMIQDSELSDYVKEKSIYLFQLIAEAEGKVHDVNPEDVHFHEVGAMDSIIDIVGVCIALEDLQIDKVFATAVPIGYGYINIAHGLYPVPAPATANLLMRIPISGFTAEGELVTPTGAVFLKGLVDEFQASPKGEISKIGYGKGTKTFEHPNILRTYLLKKK